MVTMTVDEIEALLGKNLADAVALAMGKPDLNERKWALKDYRAYDGGAFCPEKCLDHAEEVRRYIHEKYKFSLSIFYPNQYGKAEVKVFRPRPGRFDYELVTQWYDASECVAICRVFLFLVSFLEEKKENERA